MLARQGRKAVGLTPCVLPLRRRRSHSREGIEDGRASAHRGGMQEITWAGEGPMRSYHLTYGGGLESLRLREHPVPKPGPTEVLVRMRANSLSSRELNILRG